ncbi:hypothetical protein BJ875DRAFT_43351 [Amylocarpus encephaloides]|uniref:Uncharacterized protein n=1 Tax=Amylocarpus encephaloides TaxID=45428 RepID=A0A9P7YHE2_9HELO|nr:hypothetical protein BJ875DRAFT_43351 [Amylocarpus encephaloides]
MPWLDGCNVYLLAFTIGQVSCFIFSLTFFRIREVWAFDKTHGLILSSKVAVWSRNHSFTFHPPFISQEATVVCCNYGGKKAESVASSEELELLPPDGVEFTSSFVDVTLSTTPHPDRSSRGVARCVNDDPAAPGWVIPYGRVTAEGAEGGRLACTGWRGEFVVLYFVCRGRICSLGGEKDGACVNPQLLHWLVMIPPPLSVTRRVLLGGFYLFLSSPPEKWLHEPPRLVSSSPMASRPRSGVCGGERRVERRFLYPCIYRQTRLHYTNAQHKVSEEPSW